MIIVLKPDYTRDELEKVEKFLSDNGFRCGYAKNAETAVLITEGNEDAIECERIRAFPIVQDVRRINAGYKYKTAKPVLDAFMFIAGPCSVESENQIVSIAQKLKDIGVNVLRGGCFKPRTSPYAFQGLGKEGLQYLLKAKKAAKMPVVTEITDPRQLEYFTDVDIIQVGARNMYNYELLRELGRTEKPVLLKRGLSATVREWLLSAEYILNGGNENVILCERGIRTFESCTRNTLDLSAIAVIKQTTNLSVIVDPSHATGKREYIERMALAAVAAGADGIMLEVHEDPVNSLSDGMQALSVAECKRLYDKCKRILSVLYA